MDSFELLLLDSDATRHDSTRRDKGQRRVPLCYFLASSIFIEVREKECAHVDQYEFKLQNWPMNHNQPISMFQYLQHIKGFFLFYEIKSTLQKINPYENRQKIMMLILSTYNLTGNYERMKTQHSFQKVLANYLSDKF